MQALILERKRQIALREIEMDESLNPDDVRIAISTVGICGSDMHYYQHGRIGPFVVEEPMILGHEASGVVIEVGAGVHHLHVGDRVTMEPGIPNASSKASRLGIYNLDPAVRFWATPPVHGVLRPSVVHPAAFTFRIADNIGFDEAAMVEPLAVGMHAANKARVCPGDIAVVIGAGPIGMVTALSALASGCSRIVITDPVQSKREIAASLGPITTVDSENEVLSAVVADLTEGWGADIVFECSGNSVAAEGIFEPLAPGGRLVLVGMPGKPVAFDVVAAQVKEARIETVFRYAHVYSRALSLMSSGHIDVKPLITDTFSFHQSVSAFDYACAMPPTSVKVQIDLETG